jgi:membrane-bound lytic murein transglycosylase B
MAIVQTLPAGRAAYAEPTISDSAYSAVAPFETSITEAAQRWKLPASWIRAVMQAESRGDAHAVSPKGAMGLMQIMPETWAELRARYGLGVDPFDPHDNILAGAAYLRELHDRYGSPGFLAAYNAGPARYADHLATGQPLPDETRAYLAMLTPAISSGVVDDTIMVAITTRPWTDAPLFIVRSNNAAATSGLQAGRRAKEAGAQDVTTLAPQSDGLFVQGPRRNASP